ncbi:hypothetical protein C8F04DRAFT_1025926 [Mycena alexandri]|uniref:F-box domain-containing protein n=1 Tax=Mycena alexandri TaxID=1745969 RepID=A0AAD6TIC9_9AGAR|nr:hypothetical protein C8F04DRAFT_1025926 [Mycena alexandri]
MLPELVEYILDFLHDFDDRGTLLSCSLVSRAWVQSSQKCLFSNIVLRNSPFWHLRYPGVTGILSHRLNSLLNGTPHIARYIRALRIENSGFGTSCWLNSEPSFPQLLSKLSNLRNLALYAIRWEDLSEDRQQPLRALLASPTLSSVRLHRCSTFFQFLALISMAPNLKRLSLARASSYFEPEPDLPDDHRTLSKPATLDVLALYETILPENFTSAVSQYLDITRLHTLIFLDNDTYVSAAPLLALLGQTGTLQRLELGDIPEPTDFDLRLIPSLRQLSFVGVQMGEGQLSTAHLIQFLSGIPQAEDICIEVEIYSAWPEGIHWDVWAKLDDLSEWNHLRNITFDVCVYWSESLVPCAPDSPVAMNELANLKAIFPRLSGNGILRVNLISALSPNSYM